MSLLIEEYIRKPFIVDAVLVTLDNMQEVAEWCGGEVLIDNQGGRLTSFIKVDVTRPMNDRQTKAFVGDRVLKTKSGVKCYSKKAFATCFEKREKPSEEQNLWPAQEPLFVGPAPSEDELAADVNN